MMIERITDDILMMPMALATDKVVQSIGKDLHEIVTTPQTRRQLAARHLYGVIKRHVDIDDSLDSAAATSEAGYSPQDPTADANYVLLERHSGAWIGMASRMPSIRLREPRNHAAGLLPAALTRRVGPLSVEKVVTGPNVTAWMDSRIQTIARLAAVYEALVEGHEGAWTLEPGGTLSTKAVELSGMELRCSMRFDDIETPDIQPLRGLYVHNAARTSEGQ